MRKQCIESHTDKNIETIEFNFTVMNTLHTRKTVYVHVGVGNWCDLRF